MLCTFRITILRGFCEQIFKLCIESNSASFGYVESSICTNLKFAENGPAKLKPLTFMYKACHLVLFLKVLYIVPHRQSWNNPERKKILQRLSPKHTACGVAQSP